MAATSAVSDSPSKPRVLEHRRCLLLAIAGYTAETTPRSPTLKRILEAGFLVQVKSWLDDILMGTVGGMDLLLHLLSNIAPLPVTKEMVTTCRLGKAVVAVLKHKICVGSPNEKAISSRVQTVKTSWSEAVKALRNGTNDSAKRPSEDDGPAAKKVKREAPKPALSSLLKKFQSENVKAASSTESDSPKGQDSVAKQKEKTSSANVAAASEAPKESAPSTITQKKVRKIRWADSSGNVLAVAHEKKDPTAASASEPMSQDPRVSRWSDRKKKDLSHEKEMLLKARKTDTLDDDKEDLLNAMAMMAGPWKRPLPLPEDKENPPVRVESKELSIQTIRMNAVPAVRYASEDLVPITPTLLSDVEKALETLNTATPKDIPFFAPPPVPAIPTITAAGFPAAMPNVSTSTEATVETVLMMGLPLFLVGSNVQALQTLAAAPSLLTTFRDAHGNYDQHGLLNLVQTLTQNLAPSQASTVQTVGYAGGNALQSTQQFYQPTPPIAQTSLYSSSALNGQAQAAPSQQSLIQPTQTTSRGYRGDQNLGEANLHLSGYGPTTTTEEIIALFAPYVHVVEVVPKSNFSFVNTRDPEGAKRAREALNGSLLGGMPCRINMATRKTRAPEHGAMTAVVNPSAAIGDLTSLPRNSLGQVDFDSVRDDRGNPATKNLFVAGYGPGTTEQQLRDLVAQYATVVSVVIKSTFAFVNTTDRDAAVIARQSLGGHMVNGGPLRINFAKESGRLGTSFDSTYGPAQTGVASYGRFR
ncbi:hypothetical protein HJC23_002573 [Cyclotella cryptica]|uniref:RRM domain-containing protein n=1 Tax=Cyclotella cryptica TaxID=29204 RepID=A0ABD3QVU9_9STRA